MGVSGCGKSTVAAALADRIGGRYTDADDLHSDEARAKMAAGIPLTDEDREPWLQRVAALIQRESNAGVTAVVACSALRRRYRDLLREHSGVGLFFVHLSGSVEMLTARMTSRSDHFMPAALLGSQLRTLEPLGPEESGIVIDANDLVENILERVDAAVSLE